MAASKCTKLRNGHLAVECDHPRARHMYEIAEELDCTIEDLVGPERARFYPANKQEADLVDAMRNMSLDEQEAFAMIVHALSIGMLSPDDVHAMIDRNPRGALMSWRKGLSSEQAAQLRAEAMGHSAESGAHP